MNVWQHSLLSQRKFGGLAEDYEAIHSFIDSSKLFNYHSKHRLLIHNLYGVELCMQLFGDLITNSDGKKVMVRDIAREHCREDLSGKVPTLYEWLKDNPDLEDWVTHCPQLADEELNQFLWKPFLRSGLRASLAITFSDFGVYLVETFYGWEKAKKFATALDTQLKVKDFLNQFRFTERWQYTPQPEELKWLKANE